MLISILSMAKFPFLKFANYTFRRHVQIVFLSFTPFSDGFCCIFSQSSYIFHSKYIEIDTKIWLTFWKLKLRILAHLQLKLPECSIRIRHRRRCRCRCHLSHSHPICVHGVIWMYLSCRWKMAGNLFCCLGVCFKLHRFFIASILCVEHGVRWHWISVRIFLH